jgi:hypothetical protein
MHLGQIFAWIGDLFITRLMGQEWSQTLFCGFLFGGVYMRMNSVTVCHAESDSVVQGWHISRIKHSHISWYWGPVAHL